MVDRWLKTKIPQRVHIQWTQSRRLDSLASFEWDCAEVWHFETFQLFDANDERVQF